MTPHTEESSGVAKGVAGGVPGSGIVPTVGPTTGMNGTGMNGISSVSGLPSNIPSNLPVALPGSLPGSLPAASQAPLGAPLGAPMAAPMAAAMESEMGDGMTAELGNIESVKEQNRRLIFTLCFAILGYGSVSLSVVYFNWWFFTSGFKFPVFISWLQQVVGFGIFNIGARGGQYFSSWRAVFPPASFNRNVIKTCVPLSISFVLTIGLSNICLQKTLLSTYQVARSLTLLFVILLSYIMLREKQTPLVLFSCALLVAGFVVGSLDPSTLSLGGLLAGGLSSFFQAFYNVLIKYTLPHVGGDNQMLLFYNVMLSSVFFLPMALICEGFQPFREASGAVPGVNLWIVWGGIALSGLLGTILNMTQYLLIQVTTPLSFNMIGFMKALVQSLGGIVFFGDPVSIESGLGLAISTVGSALYTAAKHRVMRQREALDEAERAGGDTATTTAHHSLTSGGDPDGEHGGVHGGDHAGDHGVELEAVASKRTKKPLNPALPASAFPTSVLPSSILPSSVLPSSVLPSSVLPSSALPTTPSQKLGREVEQHVTHTPDTELPMADYDGPAAARNDAAITNDPTLPASIITINDATQK